MPDPREEQERYIAKPVTYHAKDWHVIDTETGYRVGDHFRGGFASVDARNAAARLNRIDAQRGGS
jgi:hypothetical protein